MARRFASASSEFINLQTDNEMKKKTYKVPATTVNHAEPVAMMAMSLDTSSAQWKDDVELETKEETNWNNIWQ